MSRDSLCVEDQMESRMFKMYPYINSDSGNKLLLHIKASW